MIHRYQHSPWQNQNQRPTQDLNMALGSCMCHLHLHASTALHQDISRTDCLYSHWSQASLQPRAAASTTDTNVASSGITDHRGGGPPLWPLSLTRARWILCKLQAVAQPHTNFTGQQHAVTTAIMFPVGTLSTAYAPLHFFLSSPPPHHIFVFCLFFF